MEVKDVAWLRDGIARALNWDVDVADGIAQAIAGEESQAEVDKMLTEFCGDNTDVAALVQAYHASQPQTVKLGQKAKPGQQRQRNPPPSASAAPQRAEREGGGGSQRGFAVTTQRGTAVSRGGTAHPCAAARAGDQSQAAGADVVDGLRVKRNPRKAAKSNTSAEPPNTEPPKAKPALERTICNCLGCGKIYDCRGTMSADSAAFVVSGGMCTFCGLKIALNSRERSETRDNRDAPSSATAAAAAAKKAPEAKVGAGESGDAAEKAAVAFKDRLVAADRDGAMRTAVLDDQADFFEIDSNAWLSEEEKRSMRERQKAMPDADEAHRKRFTVSFDMLGRQVITSDEPEGDLAEAEAGGCLSDTGAAMSDAAAAASAATAREIPQGGGTATRAAAAAAAAFRIPRNPGLQLQPMFVRPPLKPEHTASSGYKRQDSTSSGKLPAKGADGDEASGKQGKSKSASLNGCKSRRRQLPRLQHDDPTSAAIAPEI